MEQWNLVWDKFENQEVCNQRLRLECADAGGEQRCRCRTSNVGRYTLYGVEKDVNQVYILQHYYTNATLVNDEERINHDPGHMYKYGLKCVMTVVKDNQGRQLPS